LSAIDSRFFRERANENSPLRKAIMWRERGSFGPSPASRKVQALARDKSDQGPFWRRGQSVARARPQSFRDQSPFSGNRGHFHGRRDQNLVRSPARLEPRGATKIDA
jgi:hypothetical protein